MNLSREEARALFPEGRGRDVSQTDAEPWVSIDRTGVGWVVTVGDDRWTIPAHKESRVIDELEAHFTEPVVFWDLLISPDVTRDVCDSIRTIES